MDTPTTMNPQLEAAAGAVSERLRCLIENL